MKTAALTEQHPKAAVSVVSATWALFLGIAFLMLGNSLQGILIGVRSSTEGFSLLVSGVIMAAYFAGFLAGSAYALRALASVGHIRVFSALASVASAVVLAHSLWVTPVTWTLMRFVFGLCMAGIYVVAESWLNDLATNQTRGRLLAVYMVITMGAMASGQLLLNVASTDGFTLFILASILVSLSLVPVSLSASSSPPVVAPVHMTLRELWSIVPTGVFTSFWVGAAAGALMGMGSVYAATIGMTTRQISLFLAAPMVGAVLAQWPIGWLSDRWSRRGVILGVSAAGALISLGPLIVADTGSEAVGFMFLLGAMVFPLYSLSVAYTNDWLPAKRIVGASGVLVRINGMGAVVGPVLAAILMNAFSPKMFFWTMSLSHAVIAIFVLYRISAVEALPHEAQRKFIPFPGRGGIMAARLVPKRTRKGVDLTQHRRRPR